MDMAFPNAAAPPTPFLHERPCAHATDPETKGKVSTRGRILDGPVGRA
jgi:hypothetical protein